MSSFARLVPARFRQGSQGSSGGAFKGFTQRFAVILSGELLQSAFHFLLNIHLVRTLSLHDYGLFAIVFTAGAVGIAYVRAVTAVPATLLISHSLGRPTASGYDVLFGSIALLVTGGMGLLAVAALWPSVGGPTAFAGGAFITCYTFRSYQRIVLLAHKAPRVAGLSDLIYAIAGIGLIALMTVTGEPELSKAFWALAFAHALGIAVSFFRMGRPLRATSSRRMWGRYVALRQQVLWSLTAITSITLQGQGMTLVFAMIAGPAAYAPIAATLVLYAILRIPTNALTNMVLPEITGLLAAGRATSARRLVVRSTALIMVACLFYGVAMWLLLPQIEHYLFKGRFAHEPMGWIGFGIWAVVTVSLIYAIPRAYLEASAAFKGIATGALVSAIIGFAVMIPLVLTMPPAFAIAGLIASEMAVAAYSVFMFLKLSRQAERALKERPAVKPEAAQTIGREVVGAGA
jgi:O-antigen/teichoic acid export membrane protein